MLPAIYLLFMDQIELGKLPFPLRVRLKQLVKDLPLGEVLMNTDVARPTKTKSTRYRTARTIGGYGS